MTKLAAPGPVRDTLWRASGVSPVLVAVTDWALLALPTS
jgi:hypothetical protein